MASDPAIHGGTKAHGAEPCGSVPIVIAWAFRPDAPIAQGSGCRAHADGSQSRHSPVPMVESAVEGSVQDRIYRIGPPRARGMSWPPRGGAGHRLGRTSQQRLPALLPVLGHRRDAHPPGRPGGLRQRPAAALHRTEGRPPPPGDRLHRQPARLQGHDTPALLAQRPDHPLQRQPQPGGQHHRRLGALRRVEEDGRRVRTGPRLPGDHAAGCLRAHALPGPGGELHPVPGGARRADQAHRQEPPVPRRQQRPGGPGGRPPAEEVGSASSGTPRAAARASP